MGSVESLRLEETETRLDVDLIDGRSSIDMIDQIITNIYLPFRGQEGFGTERAIYVEPSHSRHKENDAEHSWHLALTVQALWDSREALGLQFPEDFEIAKAVQMAVTHDLMEIWAPDVDLATPHLELVQSKEDRERAAKEHAVKTYPFLGGIAVLWEEYEEKGTPEARFVSDVDKILGVRQIFLDGGKKWKNWEGYGIDRDRHTAILRGKLRTPAGNKMFDVIEMDFDNHPGMFPEYTGPVNQEKEK